MPTTRFCTVLGVPERTWRRKSGPGQGCAPGERAMAPPGPRCSRPPTRPGAPGMPPQGLGHGASRRPPGLPGHRVATAARTRDCCWRRTTSVNGASSPPDARPRSPPSPRARTRYGSWTSRDHQRRHLADRRMPGLLVQVTSTAGTSPRPGTSTTRSPRPTSPWSTTCNCSARR